MRRERETPPSSLGGGPTSRIGGGPYLGAPLFFRGGSPFPFPPPPELFPITGRPSLPPPPATLNGDPLPLGGLMVGGTEPPPAPLPCCMCPPQTHNVHRSPTRRGGSLIRGGGGAHLPSLKVLHSLCWGGHGLLPPPSPPPSVAEVPQYPITPPPFPIILRGGHRVCPPPPPRGDPMSSPPPPNGSTHTQQRRPSALFCRGMGMGGGRGWGGVHLPTPLTLSCCSTAPCTRKWGPS